MAFSSWSDPEVITAICAGVATILGTIATAFKRIKGKTWKELFEFLIKENKEIVKEVSDVAKKEVETIKEIIKEKNKDKEIESKKYN